MRVILIRPPSSQGGLTKTSLAQHPINLCSLASYVMQFKHEVKIIDLEVQELDLEDIKKFSPDMIGFTAMTPGIMGAARIAKRIREALVNKPMIVVGGNHVTARPRKTLEEFPIFDVGVVGEGELIIEELCDKKSLDKVLGIVYRDDGEIILNKRRPVIEDLDKLPFPARDLLDMNLYKGASTPGISRQFMKITELYINRGCNWNLCTFCASKITHCKFRTRSIDYVVREMKECIEKYGIQHFTIDDDTLTSSKERTLEFCEKVKPLGVTWDCDSRVTIDKEMLDKMKDAGCLKVAFGVETGSQKILKLIRKGITIKQVKDAFTWGKEVGVELSAFIMIGSHPEETWEDIGLTNKLIKEIDPDFVTTAIAVPFPGTELRTQMVERKLVFSNNWDNYALYNIKPCWRTVNFTSDDLVNIQKDMIRKFYLRPTYIVRRLSKIKSLKELGYWVNAFFGVRKMFF